MISQKIPEKKIEEGSLVGSFKLEKVNTLEGIKSKSYLYTHQRLGTKLYHLHNTNLNKLFAICFKTPPGDSSGVAHILEHSVLGGSRKFKVKDPFNEMSKSSMSTFINAFTFPDKTIYPVSSQIKKDFYNLVEVYLDAVLFPNLTELTFSQEGYHFEFEDLDNADSELLIKGIVYNEMKGVYSNLDSIVAENSFRKLFPDTIYSNDSGGDPKVIPQLQYQDFLNFHSKNYHPSNAKIYVSGDLDIKELIEFVDNNYLAHFEKNIIKNEIGVQKPWNSARRFEIDYPAQESEKDDYALTRNWMFNPILDHLETTALLIIEEIIMGDSGSILRKSLIDSKLGTSLTAGSGYSIEIKQTFFSVGLKGVEKENISKVEELIESVLQKVYDQGWSERDLERAFHQLEFHNSEIKGGSMPFDISLMVTSFQSWLYEGDPDMYLDLRPYLLDVKKVLKDDPAYLQKVFHKYFIANNHNVTIEFLPNTSYVESDEKDLAQELARKKSSLNNEQIKEIISFSKTLLQEQQRQNTAEDIATLPSISIKDINREIITIPRKENNIGDVPVIFNNLFTNGIFYLDLYYKIENIDSEVMRYLPFLVTAMSSVGLDSEVYDWPGTQATDSSDIEANLRNLEKSEGAVKIPYDAFSNLKSLKTGGIVSHFNVTPRVDDPDKVDFGIFLSGKCLERNIPTLAALMRGIIYFCDIEDTKRLKEVFLQQKAAMRSSLVPNGIRFAWGHGAARLNLSSYVKEKWSGISYLHLLEEILEDGVETVLPHMKNVRDEVFNSKNLTMHVICPDDVYEKHEKLLEKEFSGNLGKLPAFKETKAQKSAEYSFEFAKNFVPLPEPKITGKSTNANTDNNADEIFTGIALEAPVSYATLAFKTTSYSSSEAPYFYFLQNFLSSGYLNDRIRIQGGAYGGFASYFGLEGIMGFGSYRDPNIISSVGIFKECVQWLKSGDFEPSEIERSLIGSMSGLDKPMTPAAAGSLSFSRYLSGNNDALRKRFRSSLLDLNIETLMSNTLSILNSIEHYVYTIVASERNLLKLKDELGLEKLNIMKP